MPPTGQLAAVAARLRAQSAELLALADAIESETVPASITITVSDVQPDALKLAAGFITANPGAFGQAVANAAGIDFGHFRRTIVPALKAKGFTNKRGDGYRPPRCSA